VLALERDGANALLRRYVYGNDLISETTPAGAFYLHYDNNGSATNATNATGTTQWTRLYEPFGTKRSESNASGAPIVPAQYTGEYLDATTNLYNLRARQYDPTSGRFLSTDPLAQAISDPYVAEYAYVGNQPTFLLDPSGLRGCGWRDLNPLGCIERGYQALDDTGDTIAKLPQTTYHAAKDTCHNAGATGLSCAWVLWGAADQLLIAPLTSCIQVLGDPDVHVDSITATRACANAAIAIVPIGRGTTMMKSALEAETLAAKSGSQILTNKAIGDAAADAIASQYSGALREVTLQAASGARRLDLLTPQGLAIESKVGRTSLTKATRQQIQRDVELMNDPLGGVTSVEWQFGTSPITGRGGPTGPLEAALRAAGIGIR
jgi:RHS repeat-associated protein